MKHSGGAVVLMDVVRAALRNPQVERVSVFCSPGDTRRFSFPASSRLHEVECPDAEASVFRRIQWLTSGIQAACRQQRIDVLLCMSGIGLADVPVVSFVQQSLPMCPEALALCDWKTRLRMRVIGGLMRQTARRAKWVIAQTPTMREWTRDQFGVPGERISVTEPWGDSIGMEGEAPSSLHAMLSAPQGRRILYVGNTSAYKNVARLIRATQILRREFPETTLFLTCPPDHPFCREPGVTGLGYLSGPTLTAAFGYATVFTTASLVESGNLTLVEALVAGTCIAAADRPYARDLCHDAALYFDPLDPADVARTLAPLMNDEVLRRQLAERGRQIATAGRQQRPYDKLIERTLGIAARG